MVLNFFRKMNHLICILLALDTEGLFRVPGEWVAVNKLKKELDEGKCSRSL